MRIERTVTVVRIVGHAQIHFLQLDGFAGGVRSARGKSYCAEPVPQPGTPPLAVPALKQIVGSAILLEDHHHVLNLARDGGVDRAAAAAAIETRENTA